MLDLNKFASGDYKEEDLYFVVNELSEMITQKRKKQPADEGVVRANVVGQLGIIEFYGENLPGIIDHLGFELTDELTAIIHTIFSAYWSEDMDVQTLQQMLFYGIQQGFTVEGNVIHSEYAVRHFAAFLLSADNWYLHETQVVTFN